MSTMSDQIAIQNNEYRESLLQDARDQNKYIVKLMDETVILREQEQSSHRLGKF